MPEKEQTVILRFRDLVTEQEGTIRPDATIRNFAEIRDIIREING